jgi:hypothetical protein
MPAYLAEFYVAERLRRMLIEAVEWSEKERETSKGGCSFTEKAATDNDQASVSGI